MPVFKLIIVIVALAVLVTIVIVAAYYFLTEKAVETLPEKAVEIPEEAVETPEEAVETLTYLPMHGPETYIESVLNGYETRRIWLRANCPHLFSDTWYDDTIREFSQWSVDMRMEYGLAS